MWLVPSGAARNEMSAVGIMKSIVPITRFNKGEANRIFDEFQASGTKIVVKNNKPACVLLSPAQYESLMETLSDYILLEEAGKRAAANDDNDNISIPRSVQQSIPVRCVFNDGIWQVGRKHSMTWRFADINYIAASDEDRRSIFSSYVAVLNTLPTDAGAKITIINHRLNPRDFERQILMKEKGDGLDRYRRDVNNITRARAA